MPWMRTTLMIWLALAALTFANLSGLGPVSAGERFAGVKSASTDGVGMTAAGIFPAARDASCGTLLKGATDWPPSRQGAWLYRCSDTSDLWPYVAIDAGRYQIARSFVSFDTSSIPASASVVSATLSLSPRLVMLTDPSGTTLEIVSASQGATLEADHYNRVASTTFASQALTGLQPDQVNSLPLNSSGLASINKGGVTQLALRLGMDLTNLAPQLPADATFSGAQLVINLDGLELTVIYEDSSGPAPGPALTRVDPDLVGSNALSSSPLPMITLGGVDFRNGAAVYLSRAGRTYMLFDVQVKGATSVAGRLPPDLPVGIYDVVVANRDGGWAMLPGGLTVTIGAGPMGFHAYFPFLLGGTVPEGGDLSSIR